MTLTIKRLVSVAISSLLLCTLLTGCIRANPPRDPSAVEPPAGVRHDFTQPELEHASGSWRIDPAMRASRVVLAFEGGSPVGVTGSDFGYISMERDGLSFGGARPDVDAAMRAALRSNRNKPLPVDVSLDGRTVADAWLIYRGDWMTSEGPTVNYWGADAPEIYAKLVAPFSPRRSAPR